ncbi:Hypothetical_protein [Hexamita inflata]|uniref:Hypothetical_protein n=1 Tax=Hexamita inflata TaxID=28002 RepID=A0AA86PRP6_9EUKA|nr:Hypothetical protein HINF_LOCUS32121 [Hexamita inflata]
MSESSPSSLAQWSRIFWRYSTNYSPSYSVCFLRNVFLAFVQNGFPFTSLLQINKSCSTRSIFSSFWRTKTDLLFNFLSFSKSDLSSLIQRFDNYQVIRQFQCLPN